MRHQSMRADSAATTTVLDGRRRRQSTADDESTRLEEPAEAELIAGAAARAAHRSCTPPANPVHPAVLALVVLGSVRHLRGAPGGHGRPAGGRYRPVADAVAASRQVGVAGPGGQRAGLPRREGKRRRAGQDRARPAQRRRGTAPAAGAGTSSQADMEQDRAADGARREERQHRDGPAEDPDAGGQRAAHHQPPVVRPAGNRRDRVVAQAAAERHRRPRSPPPASW